MSPAVQVLIWVAIIAVFWMLMIRPGRNRQKALSRLQSQIQVGDHVMISAGIFGTVRSLGEKRVELEIAPGTTITVVRQAVLERITQPSAPSVAPGTAPDRDARTDAPAPQEPDAAESRDEESE